MKLDKNSPEVFENTIASFVDMASILFAYQIGVYGFGAGAGVLYACFDAFIVVWMRRPISRFVRSISPYRLAKDKKEAGSPLGERPGQEREDGTRAAGLVVADADGRPKK